MGALSSEGQYVATRFPHHPPEMRVDAFWLTGFPASDVAEAPSEGQPVQRGSLGLGLYRFGGQFPATATSRLIWNAGVQ